MSRTNASLLVGLGLLCFGCDPARLEPPSTEEHSEAEREGLWQQFIVKPDDAFQVTFSHALQPGEDSVLAPRARITWSGDDADMKDLVLLFRIADSRVDEALAELDELRRSHDAGSTPEIVFEFSGHGLTYAELFGAEPLPAGGDMLLAPISARIGLRGLGEETFSQLLFGIVFFGEWYFFDCHSHWSLGPARTWCHSRDPFECPDCLCTQVIWRGSRRPHHPGFRQQLPSCNNLSPCWCE